MSGRGKCNRGHNLVILGMLSFFLMFIPSCSEEGNGTGYLSIVTLDQWDEQMNGEIYLDDILLGFGYWSGEIDEGDHRLSFGHVNGYLTPDNLDFLISEGESRDVSVQYSETPCWFANVMVNGEAYTGQMIEVFREGEMRVEFDFSEGMKWVASSTCPPGIFYPTEGEGTGHYVIILADPLSCSIDERLIVEGTGYFGSCELTIHWMVVH